MFVSKKYHNEVVKNLESKLELSKSLCDFQERIYKGQIEDLRRLIFIPKQEPDKLELEADNVISGSEKPFEMSDEERTKMIEGSRELDLIISGNYDLDLVN